MSWMKPLGGWLKKIRQSSAGKSPRKTKQSSKKVKKPTRKRRKVSSPHTCIAHQLMSRFSRQAQVRNPSKQTIPRLEKTIRVDKTLRVERAHLMQRTLPTERLIVLIWDLPSRPMLQVKLQSPPAILSIIEALTDITLVPVTQSRTGKSANQTGTLSAEASDAAESQISDTGMSSHCTFFNG